MPAIIFLLLWVPPAVVVTIVLFTGRGREHQKTLLSDFTNRLARILRIPEVSPRVLEAFLLGTFTVIGALSVAILLILLFQWML